MSGRGATAIAILGVIIAACREGVEPTPSDGPLLATVIPAPTTVALRHIPPQERVSGMRPPGGRPAWSRF
jgi:hypothetical protein